MKNINWIINILFLLVNLHIIRVIYIYFGLIIYLFYGLILFIIYKNRINLNVSSLKIKKSPVLLTFIFFGVYFIIINLSVLLDFDYKSNLSLLYLGKINFTYPIVIFFIVVINKFNVFKNLTMMYLVFNIISCFFLLLSVYYNNNTFLQNEYFSFKIRDGLERYSTLYGSVGQTGYSLSASLVIGMMLHLNNKYKIIIISVLSTGACLSLSRAGYYNIFLALILFILLYPNNYINKIKSLGIFLISIFVITPITLYIIGLFGYYNHFLYNVFNINIMGVDYVNAVSPPAYVNIYDRIAYSLFNDLKLLFNENIYSITDLIRGYGYKGLGISLGMFPGSDIIYIHNGFYEILISGGILFFLLFILLVYFTLYALYKFDGRIKNIELLYYNRMVIASIIIIIINLMMGASVFHPNLISFFWMGISYAIIIQIFDYEFENKIKLTGDF